MKKITENRVVNYRLHVFLWLAYIAYELTLVGLSGRPLGSPWIYVFHYALAVGFFYTQAYYILPWALKSSGNAYWLAPLSFLLEMTAFVMLSFWADELLFLLHVIPPSKTFGLNLQYCLRAVYRGILFLGSSTGYYYVIRYNSEKRKSEELERIRLNNIIQQQKAEQELIKAQNAYLKAQINPHFLFNTLDFIYHNIVKLSPEIGDAVIRLADMMRYAIDSDKMGDFVYLQDEIEQVENLLYLNQIRKQNNLPVRLSYNDNVLRLKLIPLVLLTLVENIFKHGDLTKAENPASIDIYIHDEMFHIETNNLVDGGRKPHSTHTGLTNIEKRLTYMYGDTAVLNYRVDDNQNFLLSISIPLDVLKGRVVSSAALAKNDIVLPHASAGL